MTPKQRRLIELNKHNKKQKMKKYVLLFLLIAGLLKLTSIAIGNL